MIMVIVPLAHCISAWSWKQFAYNWSHYRSR